MYQLWSRIGECPGVFVSLIDDSYGGGEFPNGTRSELWDVRFIRFC